MDQGWVKIISMWNLNPAVLIGTAVFLGGYILAVGPLRLRIAPTSTMKRSQMLWFVFGTGLILFALISPLDQLGDEYLFSAHMLQHFIISMLAPPMLLLGTPGWMIELFLVSPAIVRLARLLTRPIVAFLIFNLIFLGWHFQALYEAALRDENIHIFEHLLFMASGVLNWWPILSPTSLLPRLSYPGQSLYLFLESIPSTILGSIISFAPAVLYPTYAAAERIMNLSPMDDQQLAGLVMAMPAGMIYLAALSLIFFKWIAEEEKKAKFLTLKNLGFNQGFPK